MKSLGRILPGVVLGTVGAMIAIAAGNQLRAADLAWQSRPAPQPALEEPIGGRIDAEPDPNVVQASATYEESQPASSETTTSTGMPRQPVRRSVAQVSQTSAASWQDGQPQGRSAYQASSAQPWGQPPSATSYDTRRRPYVQVVSDAPRTTIVPEPEMVSPGTSFDAGTPVDGMPGDGMPVDGMPLDQGDFPDDGGGTCKVCPCCPPGCMPIPRPPSYFEFFGDVQAFKGPLDQGRNGNFGFSEGLNIGGHVWLTDHLGYQIGGRFSEANFNGDQSQGDSGYRDNMRTQTFITAGLFSRATSCCPWQYGAVVDWLNDDYTAHFNATQVRAEISRMGCYGNEIGFMGTFRISDEHATFNNNRTEELAPVLDGIYSLRAVDQYALFLRHRWDNCGEARVWGGLSGEGDGLVGAEFKLPVSRNFAFESNFNYLVAKNGGADGQQQDSWGLSIGIVFHPSCGKCRPFCDPYRPLFNVADNSSFFVEPKLVQQPD